MGLRVNESFKVPAFFFFEELHAIIFRRIKGLATDTKANKLKQQKQKQNTKARQKRTKVKT